MRFFKYLASLIFLSLSSSVFAVTYEYNVAGEQWYSSQSSACSNWKHSAWQYDTVKAVVNGEICEIRMKSNNALYNKATIKKREVACPTGEERPFKWWQSVPAPSMVCLSKCEYLKPAGPVKCVSVDFESPNGEEQCGDYVSSGKTCTQPDPDPSKQPKPPMDPSECKNSTGSDAYCNKPSDRPCPSGYKQAMFNNQQICVKDSPNDPNPNDPNTPPDPNNPNDPNACTAAYCPKPDNNKSCPTGYYTTSYNGSNICVKNNPNNPNDPTNPNNNPNDPNSNGGGDGGNTGGDGGNTGGEGEGGLFCDKGGKALCDSVKKLTDFFTTKPDETDDNSQIPSVSITDKTFKTDVFRVNANDCPADKTLNLPTMFGSFSRTYSFQELCQETAFFGYIVLILAYSFAVTIVLRA